MTILCSCCMKPPLPQGWYLVVKFEGVANEYYCSRECIEAHFHGACGCFVISDGHEMMGGERE